MAKNKNLEECLLSSMDYRKKKFKKKQRNIKGYEPGWVVKNDRPEEYLRDPRIYYTDEEVSKYARSGGMRRAQERIAYRDLELLELQTGSSILDIGSGPGYTAEIYRTEGYNVTCLDLIPTMVEKAREKEFDVCEGDMRDVGDIFSGRKFDGVVSVSALQWIKDLADIQKVARGVYSLLEKDSPLIIQFYPKSEKELKDTAKVFTQNGFHGQIIIDWPDIPKNRTLYLVMKRD